MPSGVSCAVSSCTFWEENNKCAASEIHIQTDYVELLRQNSEFAAEFDNNLPEVMHSIDTCCHTYKAKR